MKLNMKEIKEGAILGIIVAVSYFKIAGYNAVYGSNMEYTIGNALKVMFLK